MNALHRARRVGPIHYAFIWALLVSAGSAWGLKIETQFYGYADWDQYSTYQWVTGRPAPDPGAERQLRSAIDDRLARKGWRITLGDADLQVRTEVLRYTQIGIGILRMDVVDAPTGRLAWRGLASDIISGDRKKLPKLVAKIVKQLLKDFPKAGRK